MTRILVSALVGAIILFVFQALSWMMLNIHQDSFKHTSAQDEIMELLSANLEEGLYYMPGVDKAVTTPEEEQAFHQQNVGKPWVMLTYHEKFDMNMGLNMGLGFLLAFFICLIISMVLVNVDAESFATRMFFVLAMATLVLMGGPLTEANWFKTPGHYLSGQLLDVVIGYGLAGIWMSWWTGRK